MPCVTAGESDEIRVLKNDGVKIASTGVLLTETQYCVVHIGEENLKKDLDELCEKFSQEYLAPSWLKGQVFAPWEASCSLGRYSVLNAELAQLKGHRLPIHMLIVATEFGGKVWSIVSSQFRRLNI